MAYRRFYRRRYGGSGRRSFGRYRRRFVIRRRVGVSAASVRKIATRVVNARLKSTPEAKARWFSEHTKLFNSATGRYSWFRNETAVIRLNQPGSNWTMAYDEILKMKPADRGRETAGFEGPVQRGVEDPWDFQTPQRPTKRWRGMNEG